jgi:hypothetical protein
MRSTEDFYGERIARFLDLAEAAQEASERAGSTILKVTYAKLASQWVELAQMAERTVALAAEAAKPLPLGNADRPLH